MSDGTTADGTSAGGGATPTPPPQASPPRPSPPERTLEEQTAVLMRERGYTAEVARELAATWRCEECECAIGVPRKDDCECPCHCTCCCEGLFRCFTDCQCICPDQCHYDPDAPDAPTASSIPGPGPTSIQEPAQPPNQPDLSGSVQVESKQADASDGDGDAEMPVAPDSSLEGWELSKVYEQLRHLLSSGMSDDESDQAASPYAMEYFTRLYNEAHQTGMRPQREHNLPTLTETELTLLLTLMRVLVGSNTTVHKFTAAIKDVVRTTFRSKWSLERILLDRRATATAPAAAGPNAWGRRTPEASQETLASDTAMFRFDVTVFSGEEVTRLKKLCSESHYYADTIRKPVGDEWTVILGIMTGTIAVRALPQFLKRCCNLMQFQWFHYQMVRRAEGELFASLPAGLKIFDYNQTAKRLADAILASAVTQNQDTSGIRVMLDAAKTISYNDDLKSIHFFFDTKLDAIRWEGKAIPFRRFGLKLQNPDARYREIHELPTGERKVVIRPPRDGMQDNRYDSNYRLRLTNITRTMDIDKLAQYLKELTNNGIKMGAPIDGYGVNSEFSLTWDFFAHSHICPTALSGVNRIMWRDHAILIIHQGRPGAAPCHQCAEQGHQAAACTKAQDVWFTDSTLIVTDEMIQTIVTNRRTWTTVDEARDLFDSLGDAPSTTATTVTASGNGSPPVAEQSGPLGTSTVQTIETGDSVSKLNVTAELHEAAQSNGKPAEPNNTSVEPVSSLEVGGTLSTPVAGTQPTAIGDVTAAPKVSNAWVTAMSKFAKPKPQMKGSQSRKQPDNHGKSPKQDTSAKGHGGNPKKKPDGPGKAGKQMGSRFQPLGDDTKDEDDDEPEDEDLKKHTGTGEPHTSEHTTGRSDDTTIETDIQMVGQPPAGDDEQLRLQRQQNRQTALRAMERREEQDALDAAIARANMEKVGLTILRQANENRPIIDYAACLQAVATARSDTSRTQTSRPGTIEAIRGTLVRTPSNGNCLYMAVAEALMQIAFAANKKREDLLEMTMLVKFLVYLSNLVDADVEFVQSNAGAFLSLSDKELEGLSINDQVQKVAEHYAQVATSSSELNHILPQALWGHTDTIRLLAKGLRRRIFVISPTSDANVVHHIMFQPQRIQDRTTRTTIPSAAVHQLSYHDWLAELEADITPLVLSYTTNHYNAVLLHHDTDLIDRKIPTKKQTLTELWGAANHHVAAGTNTEAGSMVAVDTEAGPTREQLVNSQSSIHPPEIFRALSQENWSRHEKQTAIEALIFGRDRLKELLVFWHIQAEPTASGVSSAVSGTSGVSAQSGGTDSAYTPPSESTQSAASASDAEDESMRGSVAGITTRLTPLGSQSPGTPPEDDDMDGSVTTSRRSSPMYELPTPPTTAVYTEWAQLAWGRNAAEWAGQHGISPPRLDEQRALAQFAARYPEVMSELTRQHPNPFVVLDHFKDDDIRGWCLGKRLRYCVPELHHVIEQIEDVAARQVLTDWVAEINALSLPKDVVAKYRDSVKWSLLKKHAAKQLQRRSLLTRNFNRDCAYVLVLDELFPTLAAEITVIDGEELDEVCSLIEVYERRGEFRQVIERAMDDGSWEPVVAYVRRVGVHLSQPQVLVTTHQY